MSEILLQQVPRTEWVLKWPGQVVIAGCQTFWTAEVSSILQDGNIADFYQNLLSQVEYVSYCTVHCECVYSIAECVCLYHLLEVGES